LSESYSTDLRERVLVAVEAGEPAEAVAERFLIGRSLVYRRVAARTVAALEQALGPALDSITAQDAAGCFRHCRYLSPNKPAVCCVLSE